MKKAEKEYWKKANDPNARECDVEKAYLEWKDAQEKHNRLRKISSQLAERDDHL